MALYEVYGLTVSTDRPVDQFLIRTTKTEVDLQIHFQKSPPGVNTASDWGIVDNWYESNKTLSDSHPSLVVRRLKDGEFFHFRYEDGAAFILDSSGSNIWATWPDTLTYEDSLTYLLGPILGFFLHIKGIIPLHASAISFGESGIAFVGHSGVGKSTLATIFAEHGCHVLTDDILPVIEDGQGFQAMPGYPVLRLWPESADLLFGAPNALPLLSPNWTKRYVDLRQANYHFSSSPMSLSGIYLLSNKKRVASAQIELVSPSRAVIELISNVYMSKLLSATMQAKTFDFLSRLVGRVPVWRLILDMDPTSLGRMPGTIVEHQTQYFSEVHQC